MRKALLVVALMMAHVLACVAWAGTPPEKNHDYLPRVHNVIFLFDVSDSMISGYPEPADLQRIFVASRAMAMFNAVMPHVPRWQYDLNSALVTFGDCTTPKLLSALGPWTHQKYQPFYGRMRDYGTKGNRTANLSEGLQLAGQLAASAAGRTAIVVFSDGGNEGDCAQRTAAALKKELGDKIQVFAVYFGSKEVAWRNLYEVSKLTGGYARHWEDVRSLPQMKEFARDLLVREITFPYPEIFFQDKSVDLLPSEALKLEAVANFLHAIPQYHLQVDGHTTFYGNTKDNHKLAEDRARVVREALIRMYGIHPERIGVRSWGEELPRYDNENPDISQKNRQANLYLKLPLRNYPYDEKGLHTFGVNAVGDLYNTQERDKDQEWAWPANPTPPPSSNLVPSNGRPGMGGRGPMKANTAGMDPSRPIRSK